MLRKRLIPLLVVKEDHLVLARGFASHTPIGLPEVQVRRYADWDLDELICLFIDKPSPEVIGPRIAALAGYCRMPLTVGGGIRSLEDIQSRLRSGADKVAITTAAFHHPGLIEQSAQTFGSQCICIGVDVRKMGDRYEVFVDNGRHATGLEPVDYVRRVESLGAGEVLLQSIDRDGEGLGLDLTLLRNVTQATRLPVIACGGAGGPADFSAALELDGVSAVAAANWFLFSELSYRSAKLALAATTLPVRPYSI